MSDYLHNLVARALNQAESARPSDVSRKRKPMREGSKQQGEGTPVQAESLSRESPAMILVSSVQATPTVQPTPRAIESEPSPSPVPAPAPPSARPNSGPHVL